MVINHGITIPDSIFFLLATLLFRVVNSCRGSNGPVYTVKCIFHFFCSKNPGCDLKRVKITIGGNHCCELHFNKQVIYYTNAL